MDWKCAITVVTTLAMATPVLLAAQTKKPAAGKSSGRTYVNAPSHNPQLPFSDGVLVGDTLYIAGKIGIDPKTGKAASDMDTEIKLLLDYFQDTIERGGMKMDNLAWVQVFCTDLSLFDRFNQAYRARFKGPLPARAFIGTDKLLLNGHFEIMGIAVRK